MDQRMPRLRYLCQAQAGHSIRRTAVLAGANLIPVAVTRDIATAIPVSGSFVGGADAFISMNVTVTVKATDPTSVTQVYRCRIDWVNSPLLTVSRDLADLSRGLIVFDKNAPLTGYPTSALTRLSGHIRSNGTP